MNKTTGEIRIQIQQRYGPYKKSLAEVAMVTPELDMDRIKAHADSD